ncbi:MAG: 5-oxoprolinase subunit PxpB [Chitinophagaceae bacterium]|nr:5-oxoprolinase subunit PxpB [Chitinophagaceae bacterium]
MTSLDDELQPAIKLLGESAIVVEFGNLISERSNTRAISLCRRLKQQPFHGIIDLVLAYHSVTVLYDPFAIKNQWMLETPVYKWVKDQISLRLAEDSEPRSMVGKRHRIPVCYDECFATDLKSLSLELQIDSDHLTTMHCSKIYHVYMIGFQPGFPYLGDLPEKLHCSRKQDPIIVEAGSVGIAGAQTGIYPFKSPGGWNIIGRTPVSMFNNNALEPVHMNAGDEVEFFRISEPDFKSWKEEALQSSL